MEGDTFQQWKNQCLNKSDFSKKGSVDEDISHIVSFINSHDKYFTTSSCSGRIILFDGIALMCENKTVPGYLLPTTSVKEKMWSQVWRSLLEKPHLNLSHLYSMFSANTLQMHNYCTRLQ